MSGLRRKKIKEKQRTGLRLRLCPNCGEDITIKGGHFVPPSFGEKGFFVCERVILTEEQKKRLWQKD
jgi:hypothetical protein